MSQLAEYTEPGTQENWALEEIQSGWAWINAETSEQYIPQMMNLQAQDAISFDKGCYLGQEIVARMQYLGQLKKRMYRFSLATDTPPKVGDEVINAEGKQVGEIVACSAVQVSSDNVTNRAYEILAVIREEQTGDLQLASATQLTSLPLPYKCAS
jgi:folate-binding protein YgfZ